MFERRVPYEAFFLPGPSGMPTEEALSVGLRWLLSQPGEPLVVLARKGNLSNNRFLERTVRTCGIKFTSPPRVYDPPWSGGSILVPWAGEKALLQIDEHLADRTEAVCVIGWAAGSHDSWIAGHGARDVRTPQEDPAAPTIHPVVAVAMGHAGDSINHSNGLVTDAEKAMVVLTLQELVRAGYDFDVDQLAAWATSQGWHPPEIPRLREYAAKVLDGRTFRLRGGWGPPTGSVRDWESEASGHPSRD